MGARGTGFVSHILEILNLKAPGEGSGASGQREVGSLLFGEAGLVPCADVAELLLWQCLVPWQRP